MRNTVQLNSEQLRAARAILRWGQTALSKESGVSTPTIKRLEAMDGIVSANRVTIDAIVRAFEAAGIEFIPENGTGPGVCLKK